MKLYKSKLNNEQQYEFYIVFDFNRNTKIINVIRNINMFH